MSPEAGDAFDTGRLPPRHAVLLADTLRWLDGAVRDTAETWLLAAASTQNPTVFGRTCRRVLAEADQAAATHAEQRRHRRRHARLWQTDDGMQALTGQFSGLDGEIVATALHAFRRPTAPGEPRSPEQATADALVAMATAALDAAAAPASHGIRPHVTVTLDWQTLTRAGGGVADTVWTGPLPTTQIRRLLTDCGVSRLLTDPRGIPIEAGTQVRTVPAGVYRAVAVRDKMCIADGCDMPAAWCQMMHLDTPYRLGGRLTIHTAALGCAHHHRQLDHHQWAITWHHGRPILHHPNRPPDPEKHHRHRKSGTHRAHEPPDTHQRSSTESAHTGLQMGLPT